MKIRETAAQRKEKINSNICECNHSQAWHSGKISHIGPCSFPGCHCNSYRYPR